MAELSPSGFSDWVQNSWFHQLWQVIQVPKLQSSPRPSHCHHHLWLLVWCSFYEMLWWFYARCNGTHTPSKKFNFCRISPEYLPKSLGDNQDSFGKCETSLCVFFLVSMAFALELSHGCCLWPVSFLLLNREHWPKLRHVRPAVL